MIEAVNKQEAQYIEKNWKPNFYNDGASDIKGTTCILMEKMHARAVIKGLPPYITNSEMTSNLQKDYPGSNGKRFVTREGKRLETAIINFADMEQFDKAWREDLNFANTMFEIEKYIPRQKVIQCYKCKEFDHVQKWCKNEYRCGNCTENHQENKCVAEEKNYKCVNCNQGHQSQNQNCPVYKEKLCYQTNQQRQYGY